MEHIEDEQKQYRKALRRIKIQQRLKLKRYADVEALDSLSLQRVSQLQALEFLAVCESAPALFRLSYFEYPQWSLKADIHFEALLSDKEIEKTQSIINA